MVRGLLCTPLQSYLELMDTSSLYYTSIQSCSAVVFGRVIEGLDVVKTIESYGNSSGKTSKKIEIVDCGQLA